MNFFAPQGIGDALWSLHKVRAVAAHGAERINLLLASTGDDPVQRRALPFLARFPFLSSVGLAQRLCVRDGKRQSTPEGYWDYLPDGPMQDMDAFALMPNASLERGLSLEEWLSEYALDWGTMGEFRFLPEETQYAEQLRSNIGPYAVFYLGPEAGNTSAGHNRGSLWTPQQWVVLGASLQQMGLQIVVVGAAYDRSYYAHQIKRYGNNWHDFIGGWHIGQTLAAVRRASLTVAYQSGIAIASHYLGVPTVSWWRPKGDSCDPRLFISFEERMADCWCNPLYRDRYLPLIYGRCSVSEIVRFAKEKVS